ncbi:sulfite exporter TauE/SafE family protein [uncultured Desulfuromonas sp.]|uniref:sulfite exporter TauE/SafE family protein n=1 Tax=uncultured Desulfuromonas sp. TaxID=181013 RepID=UPI00262A5F04|nr:sulfite exporter TauE/SafE family protein [uncultured Desulfuromonas sp.]
MEHFSPFILVMFTLLGSLAGFLAGLLGIGGGIILVPLFLWCFPAAGFPSAHLVHAAFGTSLAIIIPTALSSTLGHCKRGNVEWHQVFYLAIGGAVGAFSGGTLAAFLPGDWLKGLFGLMQITVALKLFLFHPRLPPERITPAARPTLIAVGLGGGVFSAFFGVGGGVVAVPLMVILLQLPIHLAVGNSSALIAISSFFGALSYVIHGWGSPLLPPFSLGYVNLLVAALVAPVTMVSARVGVKVAGSFTHDRLVRVFALLLVLVGLRMLVVAFF